MYPSAARVWALYAEGSQHARPGTNQAETAVAFSAEGQRFRNAIIRTRYVPEEMGGRNWPQDYDRGAIGRDSVGNVVREQLPVVRLPYGQKNGYQDLIGSFGSRAALSRPVVAAQRYKGQLPMDQQPRIYKPKPWMDTTRGAP